MILLKKELNAIGTTLTRLFTNSHTLDHVPEIKSLGNTNESSKKVFIEKMDEIKEKDENQIYQQWSQKYSD
jgi:hypothetical protein